MIIIVGATGTIGNALLRRLTQFGVPVRALSREPEKLVARLGKLAEELDQSLIEVAAMDASDPQSMRSAFAGGSQLFLAMSNSPKQIELETSVIRIAKEMGINHIVKISSPAYDLSAPVEVARWHQEIEWVLYESGITHTILRPYAFMQNLLRQASTVKAANMFFGSMGNAACNFIDCRDIADVAAQVLTKKEWAGQIHTLTGSEVFSYPEVADRLTALLDRPIRYMNLSPEKHRTDLIELGQLPPWLANHVVEIQAMSVALPEKPTSAVKKIIGRDPRTLDAFLQEHVEHFR
ncbi:NmrA family NAD(P)-binding protein [Paenibacillus sp. ACRRX]|uniref:NmrA family NAD(P)-binding protein n=1 Tax=unclassified Paenibacillus TaxID=185978 RepID=UPI001EF731C4|nr:MULTISPECIES: NmrA family NAD(P)-binding protein [unclassified Paenibacillus]MCG7409233.1 NmrA family NAD(P)-binding protein [Paenibacillus sp. ACRRX]MDK8181775.1 NmrA family NAD(P)-binding protein [Paenibacillus sp. UMB4589-SE434]